MLSCRGCIFQGVRFFSKGKVAFNAGAVHVSLGGLLCSGTALLLLMAVGLKPMIDFTKQRVAEVSQNKLDVP